jgi:hypothetical protein
VFELQPLVSNLLLPGYCGSGDYAVCIMQYHASVPLSSVISKSNARVECVHLLFV